MHNAETGFVLRVDHEVETLEKIPEPFAHFVSHAQKCKYVNDENQPETRVVHRDYAAALYTPLWALVLNTINKLS